MITLPAIPKSQLPQGQQLWRKVVQDLQSGFLIKGTYPHYNEVIRVYTRHPEFDRQFLLIASATQTTPPVYALEIHIYAEDTRSWKLNLRHTPIPIPKWNHRWEKMINMFPDKGRLDLREQSEVISWYLQSQVDKTATQHAFDKVQYPAHRVRWMHG